ncbi:MAG TPA: Tim44-like domain-containing protein [Hydrogenophaga sp.]|uniref:Tim44 domain-containing protein n=1 Tax=Hydrogenophaga sp. TaxID=1904254 RepID=UPI002B56F04A|nr:Tim44-like domain-containing protein [Hydrogenophaga sp.]HMN92535.1 Tim44-like domain-containing protein [Hydrogenophaga sp.]
MNRFLSALVGAPGVMTGITLSVTARAAESAPDGGSPWGVWTALFGLVVALSLVGLGVSLKRGLYRNRGTARPRQTGHSQFDPVLPAQYSPLNVGNDASARPWEQSAVVEPMASVPLHGLPASLLERLPRGFDVEGFLRDSKAHFVALQAAWDRADVAALRAMMTEPMLAEVQTQLAERERAGGRDDAVSEVVMIDAKLLGIEELPDSFLASVEFSGLMREGIGAGPNPFRELWNITRPKDDKGRWLVAGVQAMQ